MNELAEIVARAIPPLFFHYIIVVFVVGVILCVCVLKFKYLYWYEQPLTFRFTIRRFFRDGEGGVGRRHPTTIMNPLSLGTRCYNAVVYPFFHHVNHETVRVYRGNDEDSPPPFERISQLLQQRGTKNGGGGGIVHKNAGLIACDSSDTLRLLLSQDTFGLSAFIGVFMDKDATATATTTTTVSDNSIKGVSVLTPRIMISFDSSIATSSYKSVSIYMSEYLAWNTYMMIERESLELVETTEYIQKSRENAAEQTLYRYSEIPWFVIPFSTVYSYLFTPPPPHSIQNTINRSGITTVPVSSANFALFYSFVNESTRDFRCCILNELTQLQSLVDHKLYRIYMLVLNEVRVIAVYVFTRSSIPPRLLLNHSTTSHRSLKYTPRTKKRTKGNRISDLHDHVSKTSTALVKYLPPVIPPRYDAFGKRISASNTKTHGMDPAAPFSSSSASGHTILRLISSIQHKTLCDTSEFLSGFQTMCSIEMSKNGNSGNVAVMIDTIAHNYRIIDHLVAKESLTWPLISQDKWYYILYNAIIHEETLCKDILMV
jgi:hypothetical protein